MGRLEMYNNNSEHKGAAMSPRISFSNDFVESNSGRKQPSKPAREAPVSTDFEFSVSSSSLQLSADELFSKGRILPLKDHPFHRPPPPPPHACSTTTLRDELLSGDRGGGDGPSLKPPLRGRWMGFLGLRKSHIGSKKPDPNAQKQGMTREGGGTSAADWE